MVLFLSLFIVHFALNNQDNSTSKNLAEEYFFDSEWKSVEENHQSQNVPDVIQNLYRAINNNSLRNFIYDSNTIRAIKCSHFKLINSAMTIKFNLSTIKVQEDIINSEIYIFKSRSSTETSYIIRLFRLTSKGYGDDFQELLEITYISSAYHGYQMLNLEKALKKWRALPELEFLITITDSRDRKINLRSSGFYFRTKTPILVTYLLKKSPLEEKLATFQNGYRATLPLLAETKATCKLEPLHVEFTKLGLGNLILQPKSVNLYRCTGYCNIFEQGYTNHAKLVQLVNKPQNGACCVPDKYEPLLIMFLDQFGNIVIKNYADMIVMGCECR